MRAGAGLVVLAAPESVQPLVASGTPEVVHYPLPDSDGAMDASSTPELLRVLGGADVLLLGPGLSHSPNTVEFVDELPHMVSGKLAKQEIRARLRS